MSLVRKRIFKTIWRKNFLNCSESNLIRTQYYTCLGTSYYEKFEKFNKQRISSFKPVRELNFDFKAANDVLKYAFDKFFAKQKFTQKHIGYLWYKTLDEVNINEFFILLQMPDTFFSWFKVIELHVWMLLFRMNQDKPNLRYVRDGVVEAMWIDMNARAKMVAPQMKNYRKTFLQMYNKFQTTLFWYDYGYLENDEILASIIWSVFFERECDDPEKLEAVVRFIRCQVKHLQLVDTKNLEENEKSGVWTSLNPHCKRFLT